MSVQRWERLRATLQESEFEAVVFEQVYAEDRRGTVAHGVSRSMTLRPARGWVVEVNDSWWSKNSDVWLGWVVTVSDPESIVRGQTRTMKRRTEVAAAVRLYVEGVSAGPLTREVAP